MAANQDRAWADYSEAFRGEVLPMILSSACFLSIGTDGDGLDVKMATEIGAALVLDKPILLLVPKGRKVSERLRRAADVVIDEWEPENPRCQEEIVAAIRKLTAD